MLECFGVTANSSRRIPRIRFVRQLLGALDGERVVPELLLNDACEQIDTTALEGISLRKPEEVRTINYFFRNRRRRKQWNAFVDSDAFIWITCGLAVLGTVLLSYV